MGATLKGTQKSLALGTTVVKVGRSPENQFILDTEEISWFHAQIGQQRRGYYVVDLGSSNGTYVNEYKLSPHVSHFLNDGDTVRFGNLTFRYLAGTSPQSSTKLASPAPQLVIANLQSKRSPVHSKTSKKNTSNWIKIAGGLASLATVFVAIWGVYTYLHPTPSPPTPTPSPTHSPSIPLLHSSYSGTYTRVDGKIFSLSLSSLTEDANGNFHATGSTGGCPAEFKGIVRADNTIIFTATQAMVVNCGLVGEFQGQVYPDGHLAGQWQGAQSQVSGSWTVS